MKILATKYRSINGLAHANLFYNTICLSLPASTNRDKVEYDKVISEYNLGSSLTKQNVHPSNLPEPEGESPHKHLKHI